MWSGGGGAFVTKNRFHQTFSHGFWGKIRHSISPTINSKTVKPKLWLKIYQICAPFAKCCSPKRHRILCAKNLRKNVDEINPR
jgi:hypothetical protein